MEKKKSLTILYCKKGIGREETIAFGNQEPDIPMPEAVGGVVVMGNVIDELKKKLTKNKAIEK